MSYLYTAALNLGVLTFMVHFYKSKDIQWGTLDYTMAGLNLVCGVVNLLFFFKELPI